MIRHHPDDELLIARASGRLASGAALLLATHLETCPACQRRLCDFEALAGVQLEATEPTPLAEGALARALAVLDAPPPAARPAAPTAAPPRLAALPEGRPWPRAMERCAIGRWRWMAPGMRYSRVTLPWDPAANVMLLRIAAGTPLAMHTHSGIEYTQVMHGSFHDGRALFAAGDFDVADGEIRHQPAVEPSGECVCLTAVEGRLLYEGRLARMFGALIGL